MINNHIQLRGSWDCLTPPYSKPIGESQLHGLEGRNTSTTACSPPGSVREAASPFAERPLSGHQVRHRPFLGAASHLQYLVSMCLREAGVALARGELGNAGGEYVGWKRGISL